MYKTIYVLQSRVDINDPPVTVLCPPFDMFYFLECAFRGDEMIILASFSLLISFFSL